MSKSSASRSLFHLPPKRFPDLGEDSAAMVTAPIRLHETALDTRKALGRLDRNEMRTLGRALRLLLAVRPPPALGRSDQRATAPTTRSLIARPAASSRRGLDGPGRTEYGRYPTIEEAAVMYVLPSGLPTYLPSGCRSSEYEYTYEAVIKWASWLGIINDGKNSAASGGDGTLRLSAQEHCGHGSY